MDNTKKKKNQKKSPKPKKGEKQEILQRSTLRLLQHVFASLSSEPLIKLSYSANRIMSMRFKKKKKLKEIFVT